LLEDKCNSDELFGHLEEWRHIAEGMQGKYERKINATTSLEINKVWVMSVGMVNGHKKRGKPIVIKYKSM